MSLVQTLMLSLRQEYAANTMDKNELRASEYGVLETFRRQSTAPGSILTEANRAAIKRSFGNSVVIPVYNAQDVTIGNVRSCTVADSENTTALLTLTFATVAFGFTMYPATYFNNQIDYQTDFDRKLRTYLLKLAGNLEGLAVAKLNTDRNTFWNADTSNVYPVTGNALQVSAAASADFYNQYGAIKRSMDFYGGTNVLASTFHQPLVRRLNAQGSGNDENDAFQFGDFNFTYSNQILNSAGIRSTAFMVENGTLAMENRNDPDAIMGSRAAGKEWDQVAMPIVGLTMGSYYTEDCTDASALHAGTTNLTRTKKEGFEFSTDICFATVYNSNRATRHNPIVKVEFSAT